MEFESALEKTCCVGIFPSLLYNADSESKRAIPVNTDYRSAAIHLAAVFERELTAGGNKVPSVKRHSLPPVPPPYKFLINHYK